MPATLTALGVAVLAILPGAVWMFAFESRVGSYKISAPDRLVRFLAASTILHAAVAGLSYHLYKTQIVTGQLVQGEVSAWAVQIAAMAYVIVPYAGGRLHGEAYIKDWRIVRLFTKNAWHPRAWDFVFSQDRPGYMRMRLKSGNWLAGFYAKVNDAPESYASAYGEESDLYLSPVIAVDFKTGEFVLDDNDDLTPEDGGILIRWNEVEYAQLFLK